MAPRRWRVSRRGSKVCAHILRKAAREGRFLFGLETGINCLRNHYICFMRLIYVDTSVFGGRFDREFAEWTDRFFRKVDKTDIRLIFSDVAEDELVNAPEAVRQFVGQIAEKNLIRVQLTEEAILLAEAYLNANVVGRSSRADCYHIALATLYRADLLVSWNFKHIVNIERIHGYNAINLLKGYQILEIRNPREAFDYEDGE